MRNEKRGRGEDKEELKRRSDDSRPGCIRGAAERGLGKVERGHQRGSAKLECGYQWNRWPNVGSTTHLPI